MYTHDGLPSVAEDVDDSERCWLSVSDLAQHLTERHRRPKHSTSDGDILRQTVLHQQPTALENLWKTALWLVMRFGFCDNQLHLIYVLLRDQFAFSSIAIHAGMLHCSHTFE